MSPESSTHLSRSQVLGSRIAYARRERGMTQERLAADAGVGLESLWKVEQGHVVQPGVFRIADIANALGMTIDGLLPARASRVTSIGYEGYDIGGFVEGVTIAGIDLVADVRLTPLSRKQGFSKRGLSEALGEVGVRYEHLRPLGNAKENRPLFAASLRTPEARAALKQLTSWRQDHHVALLCFERDEERCHRSVVLEELA